MEQNVAPPLAGRSFRLLSYFRNGLYAESPGQIMLLPTGTYRYQISLFLRQRGWLFTT